MRLAVRGLIPLPIKEKVLSRQSGYWKQSLDLDKGGYIFIQAPSGTGKTTLIHILYGLRSDYDGQVEWGGKALRAMNGEEVATMRTGPVSVIFQDMRLFPELTAWENLEIKRSLTNSTTAEQAQQWLERLGLKDRRDSLAATLSYGEQQRVAIVRALLQPFDWLLMDEPFSHLDAANTALAIALISEVVKTRGAGMVIADLDDNNYFPYTQKIIL